MRNLSKTYQDGMHAKVNPAVRNDCTPENGYSQSISKFILKI